MNPETPAPFIQCESVAAPAINSIAENCVLGLHQIGKAISAIEDHLPTQRIPMALLGGDSDVFYEIWRTNTPCRSGQFHDIAFRATAALLFGVITIDESTLNLTAEESPLRAAAEMAYRRIFSLLDAENFPQLWRTWNYLPNIHGEEGGLERYRQFNIGRHDAFSACSRTLNESPAASALGINDGVFSVAFIAGRIEPSRIENPRQVSAFAYPTQYGPRSPAFTRALTVASGGYETLFISGTASIIGHETVHCGDLIAQTQESVANLAILLEQTNACTDAAPYTLQNLMYRVYIRHARDYECIRNVLGELLGAAIHVIYVQAEICRRDLLIEIEAFATRPINSDQ